MARVRSRKREKAGDEAQGDNSPTSSTGETVRSRESIVVDERDTGEADQSEEIPHVSAR
jgi:hypothetical protein